MATSEKRTGLVRVIAPRVNGATPVGSQTSGRRAERRARRSLSSTGEHHSRLSRSASGLVSLGCDAIIALAFVLWHPTFLVVPILGPIAVVFGIFGLTYDRDKGPALFGAIVGVLATSLFVALYLYSLVTFELWP